MSMLQKKRRKERLSIILTDSTSGSVFSDELSDMLSVLKAYVLRMGVRHAEG